MADRYEVKGRIGRGGIGAVYQAFDNQLGRDVAIKRLLPMDETRLNDSAEGTLKSEAIALASLSHPNIVTIYEFAEDENGPYVVFELIDGDTLKDIIDEGALSEADFYEVADQILNALTAAQKKDILHRDIKPANIMLHWLASGKFQIKVLDFGLSKFTEKPSVQTLDQSGSFLGSIDYIAPEQIELFPLDQRTDLYSLGCVLYFSLTQRAPFTGDSVAETMSNHLAGKAVPLEDMRPDIPIAVCRWVMSLISLHPGERPDNALVALEQLTASRETGNQEITDSIPTEKKFVVPVVETAQPTNQPRVLQHTKQIVGHPEPKRPVMPSNPPTSTEPKLVSGRYQPKTTNVASSRKAVYGLIASVVALVIVAGLIYATERNKGKTPGDQLTKPIVLPGNSATQPSLAAVPKMDKLVAYYSTGGNIQNQKGEPYDFKSPVDRIGALENLIPGAHKFHFLGVPEEVENQPFVESRKNGNLDIFCQPGQKFVTHTQGLKDKVIKADKFTFALLVKLADESSGTLFRAGLANSKGKYHHRSLRVGFYHKALNIASDNPEGKAKLKFMPGEYCVVFVEVDSVNHQLSIWQKKKGQNKVTRGESIPFDLSGPIRLSNYEFGHLIVPQTAAFRKQIEVSALSIHAVGLTGQERNRLASSLIKGAGRKK